ncbi:hypothetical protein [Candidatus Parabeggiatoa sp. HSG14]|uniref:hypothetical protein n=1 Tax=Candidatus Parabeggiatoa sp. HSG14 TaxID=3055593 RepID=UPI0025A92AB3|nr:hypothetical protein [Thiotrichales bacterium HSG14]
MLDLLLEPTKMFVKGGIDVFRRSKEHKNLLIVVQDRVRREVRFNSALLQEFNKCDKNKNTFKHDEQLRVALVKSLQTEAFDEVNKGVLPLALFFETELLKDEIWPKSATNWPEKEKYLGWLKNVNTQYDLLERVYHRIKLTKTFAECGKIQGNINYVYFMLIGFEKSIANTAVCKYT